MIKALTFALRLLLAAVESLFWILSAGRAALGIGGDALRSRKALVAGTATCPAGHSFPTEGGTYECGQCSFVCPHATIRMPTIRMPNSAGD